MGPYWSYEDIGAFFCVLVVVAALVRLGIHAHLLRPSDLIAPSLTPQTSIIIFLGIALYAIQAVPPEAGDRSVGSLLDCISLLS